MAQVEETPNRGDLERIAAALLDDGPQGSDEVEGDGELRGETVTEDDEAVGPLASGIQGHTLLCHQGLNRAYVYDKSSYLPFIAGDQVYTRSYFYNGSTLIFVTGWRYMGNDAMKKSNQWTVKLPTCTGSYAYWYEDNVGYTHKWAACS